MAALSKPILKLAEYIPRIKTLYSLIAFIATCITTVVVYLVIFPNAPLLTVIVIVLFEAGFFAVLVILALKIPSTPPKSRQETSEPTLKRMNMTVDLPTWENLKHSLKEIGFTKLEREKRIWIHDRDYYFSWGEYNSKKLVFLQLKKREFIVPNLRKINSIMNIDLPNLAGITVTGYVLVCYTSNLSDTCYEYLESLKEPLRSVCFTKYTLDLLQRKDEIAKFHLKTKLAPCIVC